MRYFLKSVLGIGAFVLLLLGGLILVRNINRQPSVVLSDDTCQPPCWKTIQPGVTTGDEVYSILSEMEGVSLLQDNLTLDGTLRSISWLYNRPVEDTGGQIYFQDDRVALISILTVNSLQLGDITARLGQPEQYWTALGRGETREYVTVGLLAPAQGYQVELVINLQNNASSVLIKDSTPVFKVKYFDPARLGELLGKNDLIPNTAVQDTENLPAWTGPGRLEIPR
ncbi:MAG TPA: hypothetical protein VN363_05255 [Anaerolineales bacterium]|nr:hypothetical protein [Anaerolineales bacterium]